MINLRVDEAYAFDYLSILEIKKKNSQKDYDNYINACNFISNQIGNDLFKTIIQSVYYENLIETNTHIYHLIDLIRNDEIQLDAKIIDQANTDRYNQKKSLQHVFFKTDLFELKT